MDIRTIVTSNHVSVQGVYVRTNDNGTISVRVGEKTYTGTPVKKVNDDHT